MRHGESEHGRLGDDDLISDGSTHYFLSAPPGALAELKEDHRLQFELLTKIYYLFV